MCYKDEHDKNNVARRRHGGNCPWRLANFVYFQKLNGVFASGEFQTNGVVLLLKTILRHWNCFLSSVDTDGKDGNGLKLENNWTNFFKF